MFNLDRLKQFAEQAVVLASGAVQQAENAIGGEVERSTETTASSSPADDAMVISEQKTEADPNVELPSEDLDVAEQGAQPEDVVIKCQEDSSKSEDSLRADKAEALSRRLAVAFKTQKLQLEKQSLLLEKLTLDCARLAEEKRCAEAALNEQLTQQKEQKEARVMLLNAKDEQISTLLKEGEQLSKKHGMLIESVRRLRKDLSERDQEIADLKARPSGTLLGREQAAGFEASVVAALNVLQQRQVQFHTNSQQALAQILSCVDHTPCATGSSDPSPTESLVEDSNLTIAAQSSDNSHLDTVVHRGDSTTLEATSGVDVNERVDPPDDIDDEMYNLAYPKPH